MAFQVAELAVRTTQLVVGVFLEEVGPQLGRLAA